MGPPKSPTSPSSRFFHDSSSIYNSHIHQTSFQGPTRNRSNCRAPGPRFSRSSPCSHTESRAPCAQRTISSILFSVGGGGCPRRAEGVVWTFEGCHGAFCGIVIRQRHLTNILSRPRAAGGSVPARNGLWVREIGRVPRTRMRYHTLLPHIAARTSTDGCDAIHRGRGGWPAHALRMAAAIPPIPPVADAGECSGCRRMRHDKLAPCGARRSCRSSRRRSAREQQQSAALDGSTTRRDGGALWRRWRPQYWRGISPRSYAVVSARGGPVAAPTLAPVLCAGLHSGDRPSHHSRPSPADPKAALLPLMSSTARPSAADAPRCRR